MGLRGWSLGVKQTEEAGNQSGLEDYGPELGVIQLQQETIGG